VSDHSQNFIDYLVSLRERDAGAVATLRHSLAFKPGAYPKAYPYVERFVGKQWHAQSSPRLALYAVAGLFARHPLVDSDCSFAKAFAAVSLKRDSGSIEKRFIALLDADSETLFDYLRHAISLLAAGGIGLDYVGLLEDLSVWMNRGKTIDYISQRWARDFYQSLANADENEKY